MNKTRGLLSLVALLTIAGQILIPQSYLPIGWRFFLHIADGILLLSALIMLLFSFFRVGVTACGELCYNPDNWYWKSMTRFYGELYSYTSPFDRGEISLCKSFWLTVFAIFIVIVIGLVTLAGGSLVVTLWDAYWKFGLLKMVFAAFGFIALIATIIGIIYGLVVGWDEVQYKIDEMANDKPELKAVVETTKGVLGNLFLIGVVFLFGVILPILFIMKDAEVSFYTAIIYYLIGVVGLTLTIGGAVLLIWFVFKFLPNAVGNTVLGQFLSAKKKQFCPTLTACNIKNRKASFS